MKKLTGLLASAAIAATLSAAPAHALFLNNWIVDVDGAAGANTLGSDRIQISEFIDLIGVSYIQNTFTGPASFTFQEAGAFRASGADGAAELPGAAQLTATFTGTGSGTLAGGINFNAGGVLSLFSDTVKNFGSTAGHYGADDGTQIGTFLLTSGTGNVDATGIPNGTLTLIFQAVNLSAGYFFDEGGNDLSTMLASQLLFGFVTTNASYVANPAANVISEIADGAGSLFEDTFGPGGPYTNTPPVDFVVSNNGQYRFAVPEPGTTALIGLSLLGAALVRRKSVK